MIICVICYNYVKLILIYSLLLYISKTIKYTFILALKYGHENKEKNSC